ncbi:MAG: vWA domain-containing protein [Limisphaerales bacterium]
MRSWTSCLGPSALIAFCLTCSNEGSMTLSAQESIDQVVIVLDASGSMKQTMPGSQIQTKMDAAKDALIDVLSNIPQTTHIGLLVFSASNLRDDWAYPLGPRDDNRLLPAIRSIDPSRGTPLGEYIKKGADRLLEARARAFGYGTYRLLVVTDGEASDSDLVDDYTPDVLARGIRVDVIGVAMDQDHTLATMVHTYRRANNAATLKQAIAEVFAEVSTQDQSTTQEDAFSLLEGIPSEAALAAIQALCESGNHPIGSDPDRVFQPVSNPSQSGVRTTTSTNGGNQESYPIGPIFLMLVLFAILAMISLFKK